MAYTILIAEDDQDITNLVKLYLESSGYRVLCAPDGTAALELARTQHVDMAVLDIMMPRMNGYELTRSLRAMSRMPILILSAKNADSDKILGLELGADDYLTKPFNPLEIIARVKANPVSYTHLDVYKRQIFSQFNCFIHIFMHFPVAGHNFTAYII